ncbi:MAG: hypothetical protein LBJ00_00710 [Planctomycetaceae bacterium]|nr:hypothetical protein [Planctomycetaceae bacterium]
MFKKKPTAYTGSDIKFTYLFIIGINAGRFAENLDKPQSSCILPTSLAV